MARHIIGGTGARHLAKASAASLDSFSPNVHGAVAKSSGLTLSRTVNSPVQRLSRRWPRGSARLLPNEPAKLGLRGELAMELGELEEMVAQPRWLGRGRAPLEGNGKTQVLG
jgi:hypothetical protein